MNLNVLCYRLIQGFSLLHIYNADNVNDTELGENQTTGLVLRLYISFNFYSDLDC